MFALEPYLYLLFLVLFISGFLAGWPMVSFFILFMAVTCRMLFVATRQNRRLSTLWLISTAIRNQLPLSDLLDAEANEFKGSRGRRLLELSDQLRDGVALPVAMDQYRGLLPPQGGLAIRVGGENGTLTGCLDAIARQLERTRNPVHVNYYYLMLYVVVLSFIILCQVSFVVYYIIPRFKEIFLNFGIELPQLTIWFLSVCDLYVSYLIYFIPFFGLPLVIYWAVLARSHDWSQYVSGPMKKLVRLSMMADAPLLMIYDYFAGFFPKRETSNLMLYLSVAATESKPLDRVIRSLADHHPAPDIRRKLSRLSDQLKQGAEIWSEMQRSGFLNAHQATILRAGESSDHLAFALAQMSRSIEQNRFYRKARRWEVGRCLILFLFSGIVGMIALSMFLPLVNLIRDLS